MFTRRLMEIVIFGFYWCCLALVAIKYVYYYWLVKKININKSIGDWPSFFLFVFILLILYVLFRYLVLILYAKCKLSEKHLMANLKKECHSLEAGVKRNMEAKISTETLLSEPTLGYRSKSTETFLIDEVDGHNYGKSMQNLSMSTMKPMMKEAKSLGNILDPQLLARRTAQRKLNNTIHKKSVENLQLNSKYQNAIYAELTESLRCALLKRSKSLGSKMNVDGSGINVVDNDLLENSVEDLLQIYENFYEIQNSLKREKRPIRKAPPLPTLQPLPNTRPQIELHKKNSNFNAKNLSKSNTKFETVNEKCQIKRFK